MIKNKFYFTVLIIIFPILAQIPFGGFASSEAFRNNIPDITDSSFMFSTISKSADKNDLDFRLEYKDERGRIRLFRKDIVAFADGKNYYVAYGTHSMGAPRFRKLERCENGKFSYFRSVSLAPAGIGGHSQNGTMETWMIFDGDGKTIVELTDKVLKQYLLRTEPLLYNEYSDKNKRNGNPIDYIRRICN